MSFSSSISFTNARYAAESEALLDTLELQKKQFMHQKDLLEQSQEAYLQTARYRSCWAQTSSCIFCPCTCLVTAIPLILCCPCTCYSTFTNKKSFFEKIMECMGCGHEQPPKNRTQLCCLFCNPIYLDLPDVAQAGGPEYYSLPYERANERVRALTIHQLTAKIEEVKKQILKETLRGPSLEEIGRHRNSSLEELDKTLKGSPSKETMV